MSVFENFWKHNVRNLHDKMFILLTRDAKKSIVCTQFYAITLAPTLSRAPSEHLA